MKLKLVGVEAIYLVQVSNRLPHEPSSKDLVRNEGARHGGGRERERERESRGGMWSICGPSALEAVFLTLVGPHQVRGIFIQGAYVSIGSGDVSVGGMWGCRVERKSHAWTNFRT